MTIEAKIDELITAIERNTEAVLAAGKAPAAKKTKAKKDTANDDPAPPVPAPETGPAVPVQGPVPAAGPAVAPSPAPAPVPTPGNAAAPAPATPNSAVGDEAHLRADVKAMIGVVHRKLGPRADDVLQAELGRMRNTAGQPVTRMSEIQLQDLPVFLGELQRINSVLDGGGTL